MAILRTIPTCEFGTTFTHYGWFLCIVPVYVGALDSAAPIVAERNWIPEWYLSAVEGVFGMFCFLASSVDPQFEPMYAIRITGEIKP